MLSKEQLEKIANPGPVDVGGAQSPIVTEMAIELLSLREQLAELKKVPPSFYVLKTAYADAWGDACDLRCYEDETDVSKAKDDFGGVIIQLFTAAKSADSLTLPAPANYEDYGPMISLEKTMAALALCGIEYTVRK
ncbi:hypothetical protein RF656_21095 [Yersinia kristensenii]|uniref:hypothetical protein n=1 Tax=Yersinia kristensenii TaxID=28152 RepID=UPI002852F8AE|nr:hypothetical protein [Yersinia kristensenii]MDR4899215.1 hypothetical protein [Yersinia kristensenii]